MTKSTDKQELAMQKGGERDNQAYMVFGGKGKGKSTWLSQQADIYEQMFKEVYAGAGYEPRVFIHDMSGSRAFRHIPTVDQFIQTVESVYKKKLNLKHPLDILAIKQSNGKPIWERGKLRYVTSNFSDIQYLHKTLADHFRNGMVIFDEWTTYVRPNPPDWQIVMINNHRNYGIELFFVCHQLLRVPPFFSRGDMIAKIVLFDTGETNISYNQIISKYSCADKLWEAYQRVKKAKTTNNYIQYHEIIDV